MRKILVIPDPHDQPEVSKDRFRWLGRMIVAEQPDVVVHLGDGLSLDSLSQYDTGTLVAEGRRYEEDIDSFHHAMSVLDEPLELYNYKMRQQKQRQYHPERIYCLGNHEMRIAKAVNKDPKWAGKVSLADLRLEEMGWKVYGLTEPARVYGIAFSHYFTSGIMGRPIAGINHARTLVARTYTSAVVGHSHTRDFWEETDVFGKKNFGLVGGCYFDHPLCYTKETDRNWAGIVILRVYNTHVDPEFVSMQRVRELYEED